MYKTPESFVQMNVSIITDNSHYILCCRRPIIMLNLTFSSLLTLISVTKIITAENIKYLMGVYFPKFSHSLTSCTCRDPDRYLAMDDSNNALC